MGRVPRISSGAIFGPSLQEVVRGVERGFVVGVNLGLVGGVYLWAEACTLQRKDRSKIEGSAAKADLVAGLDSGA